MCNFLIDHHGFPVWYDLKSDVKDESQIYWHLIYNHHQKFYIRPHRENGPAIIWKNGIEFYFIKGMCHCENGPAIISPDRKVSWFINNRSISFEKWCETMNKSPEEVNFLKLKWNIH